MRANETYSEAKRQFSVKNRDVLINAQSPHKWWSTLKSAMFGLSSSLPPLDGGGGGLVCESVGKADLLSDHSDGKQSRESVDLLLTCHSSPKTYHLCLQVEWGQTFLVRLGPLWRHRPMGYVSLLLKRTADILAPHLSVLFRQLVCLDSFPACWRQANVTPNPKGHHPPLLPTTDRFP